MEALFHKKLEVKGRIWIEVEGMKFLGPGRIELLERIKQEGSISKAAKTMGMSYRKAWNLIDEMNAIAQHPVVHTQKGGQSGGGAEVSPEGEKLIEYFKALHKRFSEFLAKEQL